jgi:hypothetical protein
MSPELRAAIAAICIADTSGAPVAAVHDHEAGVRRATEAEVVGVRAICCDRESGDTLGGDLPELWHTASAAWVHVGAKGGGAYEGYDRGDEAAFAVQVSGAVAHLFEHERQAWSAYTGELSAGAF